MILSFVGLAIFVVVTELWHKAHERFMTKFLSLDADAELGDE